MPPPKNLQQIREALPEAADQPHIRALAADLDRVQALRNVLESEGGSQMLEALRNECRAVLREILREVKDPLVFKLEANLNLITTLESSKTREKDVQKVLDEELYKLTH